MSKTSYYYDPPESFNMVYKPGEVGDLCGELARITPAGNMIPLPMNAIHEEYGSREGDIHGHEDCTKAYLKKLKQEVFEIEETLRVKTKRSS